ncbi:toxin-antitoxin system YwqK family antitoxin [Acinetobacter sp. Marseille-Q1618]|uniref:toxin-antitoxin system YwqK family antitoxin n=1 Tax=Acinetobacter sp. Marseille-Q1618 TaxID=2697502 RepID=UPI00156FB1D7|nr:hypothetical protein [Acinetobacter sp. Marseille-Q1618]
MNTEKMQLITEYHNSGEIKLQYYVDEKMQKNGQLKHWSRDGKILYESNYLNNLAHGKYRQWDKHGNLVISSEYRNGKLNGFFQYWRMNGQLAEEGYYVDDMRQLGYKWYKPNGELWSVFTEEDLKNKK